MYPSLGMVPNSSEQQRKGLTLHLITLIILDFLLNTKGGAHRLVASPSSGISAPGLGLSSPGHHVVDGGLGTALQGQEDEELTVDLRRTRRRLNQWSEQSASHLCIESWLISLCILRRNSWICMYFAIELGANAIQNIMNASCPSLNKLGQVNTSYCRQT